jgi:hypothetical protein
MNMKWLLITEIERAQMVAEQINELEARRIQAMNEAKAMEWRPYH